MLSTFGRVALVAVLGVLALPLLAALGDIGGALQPGCQLPGNSERFVHLVGNGSSIDVKAQAGGDGCDTDGVPIPGIDYETPEGTGVAFNAADLVGTRASDGSFAEAASWVIPNSVVSDLGGKLVLPLWSIGAGLAIVLLAAGGIIMYGE